MATAIHKQKAALKAANAARAKNGCSPHSTGKPTAVITPEGVYAYELLADLFGIGEFTIREAEADGMRAMWFGKRKFVRGSELIAAMERQTKERLGES